MSDVYAYQSVQTHILHYIDVIMTTMASQITSTRLFNQSFIQAQIKENIKAPRRWPLCGEFTATGEFPAQRASNAENVSIWRRYHVLMYTYPLCEQALVIYSSSFLIQINYDHSMILNYVTLHAHYACQIANKQGIRDQHSHATI